MSVSYMREYLRNLPKYNRARAWLDKVNNMSDRQVIAVYYSVINRSSK